MRFTNDKMEPKTISPPDAELKGLASAIGSVIGSVRASVGMKIRRTYLNLMTSFNNNEFDSADKNLFLCFEEQIDKTCNLFRDLLLEGSGKLFSGLDTHELIQIYRKIYLEKYDINLITHRIHKRTIITIKGEVTFERHVLRPRSNYDLRLLINLTGKKTVTPLDEYLNINNLPFKITPKAMLKIAYCSASELSYNSAANRLREDNILISDETARQVTNYIGSLVYNYDNDKAEDIFINRHKLNFSNDKDDIIYIIPDGSMIHARDKDEQGCRWHENKLGVVFSSDNMHLVGTNNGIKKYKINKKEYVNFFGSVTQFQKMLFATAINNGYGRFKKTVLISDGADWISNMKDFLFPDAIHILDFWHVTEYIYELAKIFYNNDHTKYNPWVDKIKKDLLNSKYNSVIDEILDKEKFITTKKILHSNKDINKNNFSKCSNYLMSNIDKIDYKSYREQKLYIGSGHIESGNKSVAQERLKRPGMMWNIQSAQNLLTLRAKLKSDLWYMVESIVLKHLQMI
ncbi:MAG: UPF0236 family protein [Deltaproteobacteria bacterium]|nr:UPF0236 family protein [Deltaproteobacteria bacterium]